MAIINQSMARYFFGNENPIGKKIDPRGGNDYECEIVGVEKRIDLPKLFSVNHAGLDADPL